MADTKISALTAATLYSTGDVTPIVQSGTTKKLDLGTVFTKFSRTTFSNANYTGLATDRYIATTTTVFTAGRTVTLPAANALLAGTMLYIGDDGGAITTGGFTLSIARAGTDTIHGGTASIVLLSPRAAVILESDGVSNWTTVSRSPAVRVQILTTGTTFTTTVGTKAMYVECIAGGGGGGGALATASNSTAGGGGGGGGYAAVFIVNPKTSFSYAIGGAGSGGAATGANGTAGGPTSFDTAPLVNATGGGFGSGSAAGTTTASVAAVGGQGGGGTIGDVLMTSGDGEPGIRYSGTNAAGGRGGGATRGGGPVRAFAGVTAGAGVVGNPIGGGGSGGMSLSATGFAGGNGAAGCIIVTEFF